MRFIQQIERKVPSGLEQRPNGSAFVLNGRRFLTNYDGSQDEEDKTNDEVLQEFLKPFEGRDAANWPNDETRIIAINEGRLVDFLTEHEDRFAHLKQLVARWPRRARPSDGVVTVNLNLRAIVANPPGAAGDADSIFDRQLRRLTDDQFWDACASCDIRDRCYAYHNARTLMDPVAGPKVAERLRSLYAITHLRGRLHITMRDLRSALAFTLAGTRDCDEIHALYAALERKRAGRSSRVSTSTPGVVARDPPTGCCRCLGRSTSARPRTRTSTVPSTTCRRLPGRWRASRSHSAETATRNCSTRCTGNSRVTRPSAVPRDACADHRDYVAMLRRRQFFERRDEGWKEMLPYRTADEFWRLVTGALSPVSTLMTSSPRSIAAKG